MKILLINPPRVYYPGSKEARVGLPLGLMYLAAVLEENGYRPKILDCLIHPEAKKSKNKKQTRLASTPNLRHFFYDLECCMAKAVGAIFNDV
jgi:hypothetical protein